MHEGVMNASRQTQEPTLDSFGSQVHPAFGVVVVTRGHGSGRSLFQSDITHDTTITLSIHRASRARSLSRDWVHPADELVEVEMSMAQWGALVSSVGMGSGVPVTIRRTENEARVPSIPFEPRLGESIAEVETAVERLLDKLKESVGELHTAIHEKAGIRATKDALQRTESALANASKNAAFTAKSLIETGEDIVNQVRADIEAHVLEAERITGTSVTRPSIGE